MDHSLNVLVVDDQPHFLSAMRATLQKTGAHILEATSGSEALRQALCHECALILLDVHMPGMDGFETARLLRSAARTRHIPILFITGVDGGEDILLEAYQVGGVDFLRKPVTSELLVAKVSAFLEMFRRRQEEEKNLRLERELRRHQSDTERLRELAGHLQEAREAERKYIAHEIHDELGSRLAMIKMTLLHGQEASQGPLLAAEQVTRIVAQVDEAIKAVRQVTISLRPPVLDEMGLFGALEWLAQDLATRSTIQISLTPDSQNVTLQDSLKIALFRVVQEAVTNALRHGKANRVEVTLRRRRGHVQLSIADNGQGLPDQGVVWGMGFRGMAERLRPFGGVIQCERSVMGGMVLIVTIPEPVLPVGRP